GRMTWSKVRRGATDSTARRPAMPNRRAKGAGATLYASPHRGSRVRSRGDSAIQEPAELWCAFQVAILQPLDFETGVLDQGGDVTVQMASTKDLSLQWIQALLPTLDSGILRSAMLDKIQASFGTERPPHFEERPRDVGDRAERERADDRIEARIGHRDLLRREADDLDRKRRCHDAPVR